MNRDEFEVCLEKDCPHCQFARKRLAAELLDLYSCMGLNSDSKKLTLRNHLLRTAGRRTDVPFETELEKLTKEQNTSEKCANVRIFGQKGSGMSFDTLGGFPKDSSRTETAKAEKHAGGVATVSETTLKRSSVLNPAAMVGGPKPEELAAADIPLTDERDKIIDELLTFISKIDTDTCAEAYQRFGKRWFALSEYPGVPFIVRIHAILENIFTHDGISNADATVLFQMVDDEEKRTVSREITLTDAQMEVLMRPFHRSSTEKDVPCVPLPEPTEGWRKKPVVILAVQMDRAFSVRTREGDVLNGIVGDWLIKGVRGELYPCGDEIFKATYERAAKDFYCTFCKKRSYWAEECCGFDMIYFKEPENPVREDEQQAAGDAEKRVSANSQEGSRREIPTLQRDRGGDEERGCASRDAEDAPAVPIRSNPVPRSETSPAAKGFDKTDYTEERKIADDVGSRMNWKGTRATESVRTSVRLMTIDAARAGRILGRAEMEGLL